MCIDAKTPQARSWYVSSNDLRRFRHPISGKNSGLALENDGNEVYDNADTEDTAGEKPNNTDNDILSSFRYLYLRLLF